MNSLVQKVFRHCSSRKYNLASYIKIEEGQVFFNLNEQALRKIYQVRIRDFPLHVPCSLRLRLLRDALLKKEVRTLYTRKTKIYLHPGLTFYTCYSDEQEDQKLEHTYFTPSIIENKKLLRSVISPDGDILHQISSSSLQHPYFSEISATHHWLTAQLLNHLHANLNWIPQLIWVALTGFSLSTAAQSLCLGVSFESILCFVLWFVLPFLLKWLWFWLQPLVIQWSLARILSFLEK
jgi:hypothetical protein